MPDGPVPVSDLDVADRIVRAAATGPAGDREPTVAQLLAAFDEPQATPAARERVIAALTMAGASVTPDLLTTPATERVRITPPGGSKRMWSPAQRLGLGAAVIAGVIALVSVIAGQTGNGTTAEHDLPAGTTATKSTPAPAKTATATATTPTPANNGVAVLLSPATAGFVCVDDGRGRVLFHGTLSKPRTFTGRHIRVNITRESVVLTVNGHRVKLMHAPTGYDINVHHVIHLPASRRPCPAR